MAVAFPWDISWPPLSCSFWIFIHISGVVRTVAPSVKPHLLTSALPCLGITPPWTAFSDGYDQTSPLYLPTRVPRKVFTHPRTIHILELGLWPNIYVDIHSWAYHPYRLYIQLKTSDIYTTFSQQIFSQLLLVLIWNITTKITFLSTSNEHNIFLKTLIVTRSKKMDKKLILS